MKKNKSIEERIQMASDAYDDYFITNWSFRCRNYKEIIADMRKIKRAGSEKFEFDFFTSFLSDSSLGYVSGEHVGMALALWAVWYEL